MRKSLLLIFAITILSCKEEKKDFKASFATVNVDTLLTDSISIRAIAIDNDKVWYSGSRGKYGYVSLTGEKAFNGVIAFDGSLPQFEATAQTDTNVLILKVPATAKLYKTNKETNINPVIYTEEDKKVFYDSMQFLANKNGFAMGDHTNACLSVIVTRP